ncbi:hypothetical protein SGRIM128S_09422 [Streptomyces griseomycini]
MIGGFTTVEGRGSGTVGVGEGDAVGDAVSVAVCEDVPVGAAVPVGASGEVSAGAGVTVPAGVPVGTGASVVGAVVSAAKAAGSMPSAAGAVVFGSVPGSSSLTSMPAGWPPAWVPSALTTRTSTPSEAPVHTEAVPPRVAARSPSAPSAWFGSSSSFCQPDHLPVFRSRVRTSGVPLTSASGLSQVTSTALKRSVACRSSPRRPAPRFSSFTVWMLGLRAFAPGPAGSDDGPATA